MKFPHSSNPRQLDSTENCLDGTAIFFSKRKLSQLNNKMTKVIQAHSNS